MKLARIISLVLTLFLVSCTNKQAQQTSTPTKSFYSWIDDYTCAPPCWQHITPGIDTLTTTLELLQNSQNVHLALTEHLDTPHTQTTFYYRINWLLDSAYQYGSIDIENNSGIIDSISFELYTSLSRAALQERFGSPSHVVIMPYWVPESNDVDWDVSFIYLDQGIVVSNIYRNKIPQWNVLSFKQVSLVRPDENFIRSYFKRYVILNAWSETNPAKTYCQDGPYPNRCSLLDN